MCFILFLLYIAFCLVFLFMFTIDIQLDSEQVHSTSLSVVSVDCSINMTNENPRLGFGGSGGGGEKYYLLQKLGTVQVCMLGITSVFRASYLCLKQPWCETNWCFHFVCRGSTFQ